MKPHSVPTTSVDFSSGRRPLLLWFKSVALLLEVEEGRQDFTAPAKDLIHWLRAFDEWYKEECGVPRGQGLHLLYHRDVSVIGDGLLPAVREIANIASTARACGMGFSYAIRLDEALGDDRVGQLVGTPGVSTLGLTLPPDMAVVDRNAAQNLMMSVVRSGTQLAIIGPADWVARLGVLDHPVLSGVNLTLHPQSYAPVGELHRPRRPIEPCSSRFRLYIDREGHIYPCLGLVGVESTSLGSVRDPISETVLGGKPTALDLREWALQGPSVDGIDLLRRSTGLPWICEQHRWSLASPQNGIKA